MLYGACTVTFEHALIETHFTVSHYPKTFEGFAIRNSESFTTVFKLLHDPKKEIWKLYQTLTCNMALDKGRFLVIVLIPLLDNMNTFDIFNVFNMPVPVKNPIVPTDKLPSMVALYRFETTSVAVNLVQMKYVLLTTTEQGNCTSHLQYYCESEALYIP